MKNGHQNRSKFCMHFEWPFGGFWGQHDRKKPPKREPGGVMCSCFWAWKGLGKVLGPLGTSLGSFGSQFGCWEAPDARFFDSRWPGKAFRETMWGVHRVLAAVDGKRLQPIEVVLISVRINKEIHLLHTGRGCSTGSGFGTISGWILGTIFDHF